MGSSRSAGRVPDLSGSSRLVVLAFLTLLVGLLAVPLATPAGAVTDLALGKAASADSSQSGRGPSLANDGDTATGWCAADGRTGRRWQVDLGRAATLSGSEVRWEFARTQRPARRGQPDPVDLTAASEALVEGLGPNGSAALYLTQATDGVTDNTHFSSYGANEMAKLVLRRMREMNLSPVPYLR
ncbi:discoidin domain-containing protein [Nonomuraea sp. SYSU D8015]|uniref:discoidin domain-containing protein n=1 Tax=Nonomuraea sp. SYSU D8015 TaxID=2593644 RepID=UPI00166020C0|nr:discoidin domain-containing protein [Nonomuraea sp. SYSU D8015]